MRKLTVIILLAFIFIQILPTAFSEKANPVFSIKIPEDYFGELSGRFLIALTNTIENIEPFMQLSETGIPVFGKTVFGAKAGDKIEFYPGDSEIYGYPFQMEEIPNQELYIQAFVIKYKEFNRSNGTRIFGMEELGGGGNFKRNPLNMYSETIKAMIDVEEPQNIELVLTNTIPLPELKEDEVAQQGNYEDTELVKYIKIQSELLTEFWGTPIYIGANVLLPPNYDENKQYAALYYQGHFPGGNAPLNFGRDNNEANINFTKWWNNGEAPEIVTITIRDANMFYDTSYSVNSVNLGPWGDAIVEELIPYLEKEFNLVPESWARALAGGSTGGWESMAMQLFYPDIFGGAWVLCADSLDFNYYQIVNLYEDDNAYYKDLGWIKVERPGSRNVDGNIRYMMKDENFYEYAIGGPNAISQGQWAVWEAVYGPMDDSGYPKRVWNPLTGEIDKEVVAYWKENYDLNYYLEKNWDKIGDKLVGKLFLRGGDMDNYYLNLSQNLVGEFLESTENPHYDGYCITFPLLGHTGNITNIELLEEISLQMLKYGSENAQEILGLK